MASNPAHGVRWQRHSVGKGSTPALSSDEASELLKGMKVSETITLDDGTRKQFPYLVGLRDRAIIAVMTYAFVLVGAVVARTPENYFTEKKRWWLRLHEKNGKVDEMPCHHKLTECLDAYIKVAGIGNGRKGPMFRTAIGRTAKLSGRPMLRGDVWRMVGRRAADAGIETVKGCHTFRATGIKATSRTAEGSKLRGAWPGTRTQKRPASTTGATMTSAWEKLRELRLRQLGRPF